MKNLRLKSLHAKLHSLGLEGILISWPYNVAYLTHSISREAHLIISRKKNLYITDFRYIEEAKGNLGKEFKLRKIDSSLFKTVSGICAELKLRRLGFEEKYFTLAEFKKIRKELSRKVELVGTAGLVEEMRLIKDKDELAKLRIAAQIAIKAFGFIRNFIRPGISEIEVAAELERFIRYNGARCAAFDIIVASGPNSSFPHHLTSNRKIKNYEPILIDLGVDYQGYKSDLTRVFFLGKINPLSRKIYDIVRQAQGCALRKIRPAVRANMVDAAARQYIAGKGYGGFFGHSLGHGIGLEVHEDPRISQKEKNRLESGMVFTIEPAIYLPGKFGIRIEDMVSVTEKGAELISGSLHK